MKSAAAASAATGFPGTQRLVAEGPAGAVTAAADRRNGNAALFIKVICAFVFIKFDPRVSNNTTAVVTFPGAGGGWGGGGWRRPRSRRLSPGLLPVSQSLQTKSFSANNLFPHSHSCNRIYFLIFLTRCCRVNAAPIVVFFCELGTRMARQVLSQLEGLRDLT